MSHFCDERDTVDDLMRSAFGAVLAKGVANSPSRGDTLELTGVLLELTDIRARLSRTETRGKLFSCLGELAWYLSGSDDLESISYYIDAYNNEAENGVVWGAYGPRLFSNRGHNQLKNVIELLKRRPETRRAVIQLYNAEDIAAHHKDVPCTVSMQFLIRAERLQLIAHMRSNDAFKGFAHDVFCFTMIQEIVARALGVDTGSYFHSVGSFHLYRDMIHLVEQFLAEGYQSKKSPMPAMPLGDPWPSVKQFLSAESTLRLSDRAGQGLVVGVDPYWSDLIRLLEVYRCLVRKDRDRMKQVREEMASPVYDQFIQSRIET